jgi:hypothetical protein
MREPHVPGHAPRDWSEAFAALPPETPPADALSPVFARLPATPARPRFRRAWWIPVAAALALAAVIPLWMDRSGRHVVERPAVAAAIPAPKQTQTLDARLRGHDGAAATTVRSGVPTPQVAKPEPENSAPVRIAKAERPHRKPHPVRKSAPTGDPPESAMEPLYAESARLEALLALARDDRAASATAAALGSDFEARVAGIDAALAQPTLAPQRRLELWRERVSALRAYASFESTQRALAASGERYDAMLVSID